MKTLWWLCVAVGLVGIVVVIDVPLTRVATHGGPAHRGVKIIRFGWDLPASDDPAPIPEDAASALPVPCSWAQLAPVGPGYPYHEFTFGIRQDGNDRPWISNSVEPYRLGPEEVATGSVDNGYAIDKCTYPLPDNGRLIIDAHGYFYRLDAQMRRADRLSVGERLASRFATVPGTGSAIIGLIAAGVALIACCRRRSLLAIVGVACIWIALWPMATFVQQL